MTTYAAKLKDPRWQKKRLKILERDGWSCCRCGDSETSLHVHHLKYAGEPWDAPDSYLETLCESCHEEHHHAKKIGQRIADALVGHIYGEEMDAFASALENVADIRHPEPAVEVLFGAVGWMLSSKKAGAAARADLVERYLDALRAKGRNGQ